ncbi:MAG: AAC(3) family N-acetyltransferase [Eubacterium sp.]|nr:AAC(3) family N-acetyltransferase [Eubacterium sp.]MCM1215295.1 AAC(3) family N-acetyltransferase [Lachnospiraceae bacterium]MCM1303691.1 AAC(3) family N-acetyltransferase [Butyrivibrio sp.]MCM1344127.1 AAC(3) family N-acetyltransferase [Muribaculaceae bacterium]MCM1240223.1 AAC(3) family N-acetyltransferase [Lachnospiraceae bacterium]
MRYTKEDLKRQLQKAGLWHTDTILIHSSMKAIGQVEGGADTVLDAWMEYFERGLLLLPAHTWAQMSEEHAVYDPASEKSCVGLLTELFRRRPGVVRSLHPTHSVAAYGKDAAVYVAGEENCNTPCTPGGCYDRLRGVKGKILLVGVGHERNTFIHSVEEALNVPNRLTDHPVLLQVVMPDGSRKPVYMRKHYNAMQPHISEDFVKLEQAFYDTGAARKVRFGDADCILCDAESVFEVTRLCLAPDPECLVTKAAVPPERWSSLALPGPNCYHS